MNKTLNLRIDSSKTSSHRSATNQVMGLLSATCSTPTPGTDGNSLKTTVFAGEEASCPFTAMTKITSWSAGLHQPVAGFTGSD